ncbi:MAG TPA: ATP-binding protein [Candidatus Limnocylindrales bacterium]|nr:ATP-binding protein [Candidatus Limnocylindrales bacterium]
MQLVKDRFYIWYNRGATFLGAVLIVLTAAAWLVPGLELLHSRFGFIPFIGVLGAIQVIYGLVFFKRQAQTNIWVAGLLSSMVLSLITISLVHNSGQLHSTLLICWGVQMAFSGIFGLYTVVGFDFLFTFYYVIVATGQSAQNALEPTALGAVAGTYIISAISYAVFKRLYVGSESKRVTQLTGQLRNKQQQAEILMQSISDGIIVIDTEGKISLLNPAAGKMVGWAVDEAMGIDVNLVVKLLQEDGKDLPADQDPFKQVLQTSQQSNSTAQLATRGEASDRHIVSLVVSPILTPKGNELLGAIAVFRDVSAARQEEHRRADFISTASHEMRTPVAAIEGYLALALNDKVAKIDQKAREYLVKAHESTQHLGKLFQDLLTSAKAEDGRLVNHPVVVEMGSYLQQITEGLRFAAEKKGLLMDFTLGTGNGEASVTGGKVITPLYYVHIDPDRMREVITNLFDNAVKYTETGKITLGLTGDKDVVQFFIRDTGNGIPADDIPHLFQKFYRVDNTATRTIGGTGLGLFICRKIVELYHGRIWVESTQGKGSTFYINIPRLSNQKASELQTAEKQAVLG